MEEDRLMTPTDLTQQIRDFIKTTFGRDFINAIVVKPLVPQGYIVSLEAEQQHPVTYSAELSDDEFMAYIKNELKRSRIFRMDYNQAQRYTRTSDVPHNNFV